MPRNRNKNKASVESTKVKSGVKNQTPKRKEELVARKQIKKLKKSSPMVNRQNGPRTGNGYPKKIPKGLDPEQKAILTVQTDFQVDALNQGFLALLAYLGGTGIFSDTSTTGVAFPAGVIYDGIRYLFTATQAMLKGEIQELTHAPALICDLIAALSPKTVPYHGVADVSYGWNPFSTNSTLSPLNIGNGVYALTYPNNVDSGGYNDVLSMATFASNPSDNYPAFLKLTGNIVKNGMLSPRHLDAPSPLTKVADSFARIYRYVGLNPTATNGVYQDFENEVGSICPMMAAFCNYAQPDVRVPRYLGIKAGGANVAMGLPLSSVFHSYFNRLPITFKQIDFEEIYTLLCLYACLLKEAAAESLGSGTDQAGPFPFTQQDFRIMLRQALLDIFKDTQFFSQFEGYTAYDGATNAFVPLLVTPGIAPRGTFGKMLIPEIISENLNSLRGRNYQVLAKKSKVSVGTVVPILGSYYQDDVYSPQFIVNGVPVDLFTPTVPAQNIIRLQDMFMAAGSPGAQYADPNSSYYQSVCQAWNWHIEKLAPFSVPTRPIVTDMGPQGVGLLFGTKLQKGGGGEFKTKKKAAFSFENPMLRNCANAQAKELTRQDSKGKIIQIEAIPPASVVSLNTTHLLNTHSIGTEMAQFQQTVIMPVVRENPQEDALLCTMYQTITNEVCSTQVSSVTLAFGSGVYSDLSRYAGLCVTGLAKEVNNTYIAMFNNLQQLNKGGILGSLLGGLGNALGIPQEITKIAETIIPF